jgi:hypothetical protein
MLGRPLVTCHSLLHQAVGQLDVLPCSCTLGLPAACRRPSRLPSQPTHPTKRDAALLQSLLNACSETGSTK